MAADDHPTDEQIAAAARVARAWVEIGVLAPQQEAKVAHNLVEVIRRRDDRAADVLRAQLVTRN